MWEFCIWMSENVLWDIIPNVSNDGHMVNMTLLVIRSWECAHFMCTFFTLFIWQRLPVWGLIYMSSLVFDQRHTWWAIVNHWKFLQSINHVCTFHTDQTVCVLFMWMPSATTSCDGWQRQRGDGEAADEVHTSAQSIPSGFKLIINTVRFIILRTSYYWIIFDDL